MKKRAEAKPITDVICNFEEAIRNEIVVEPKAPALQIAEQLMKQADPDELEVLVQHVVVAYLARLVRIERAKQARTHRAQLALPGFEHLPLSIRVSEQERVPLHQATFTQVRAYYRLLRRKFKEQGESSEKLKEAKALMDRMEKKDRGLTVAQVLGIAE